MISYPNNPNNSFNFSYKSLNTSYIAISPFSCGFFPAATISISFCFSPFNPSLTNFPNVSRTKFPIFHTALPSLKSSLFNIPANKPANFPAVFTCNNVGAARNLHEIPRESIRKQRDEHHAEGVTNGGKMRIDEAARRHARLDETTAKGNRIIG